MKKCQYKCCSFPESYPKEKLYCASGKDAYMYPYFDKISKNIDFVDGKPYYKSPPHKHYDRGLLVGNITKKGYRRCGVSINGVIKRLMIHRIAWYLEYGVIPQMQVDHIDQNKDNNDISNLRLVTNGQNQMNTFKRPGSTSIYKGVCHHGRDNNFRAQLTYNNKMYRMGTYENQEEAARAYDQAIVDLELIEYAILNFPENIDMYRSLKGTKDYKTTDLSKYKNRLPEKARRKE